MELANEIALVTGASRGIGAAIVQTLTERGAYVIGTATTTAGAEGISTALGARGQGVVLDVTQAATIETLFTQLKAQERLPSILVNNAGITRDQLAMRLKDEDWDAVIDTNLSAVFRLSRAAIRGMLKQRRGRIITIGSVVGAMGNAGQVNYAAAKAGLVGFSKALAREVAPRGVTVNVVAPGFIETDMTRNLPEVQRDALRQQIPMQRLGAASEVAHAVAFLASPGAGYITGSVLHINGGLWME